MGIASQHLYFTHFSRHSSDPSLAQFKLEFRVAPSVLGLVIGKEGKNVERVAKMPGVESVRVQRESFSVLILAKVCARVCGSQ